MPHISASIPVTTLAINAKSHLSVIPESQTIMQQLCKPSISQTLTDDCPASLVIDQKSSLDAPGFAILEVVDEEF
jgi:hypothetical protein